MQASKILKRLLYQSWHFVFVKNTWSFMRAHKRLPNLNPVTFNDILFRIKMFEHNNPLRVHISDKEFVKDYVSLKVGNQHNVETYGIIRTASDIERYFQESKLPEKYVVKPTHMSGECIIVENFPTAEQMQSMRRWFGENYFYQYGELNYKTLTPKIIVEKFLTLDGDNSLEDYKLFCSRGQIILIQVDQDRATAHKRKLYAADWQPLPFEFKKGGGVDVPRPRLLQQMLTIASRLSQDFDFIRVDLYTNGTQVFLGELTNAPEAACGVFNPPEIDAMIGEILLNPKSSVVDFYSSINVTTEETPLITSQAA